MLQRCLGATDSAAISDVVPILKPQMGGPEWWITLTHDFKRPFRYVAGEECDNRPFFHCNREETNF